MPAVRAVNPPVIPNTDQANRNARRRKERLLRVVKIAFTALLAVAMTFLQTPIFVTGLFCGVAFRPQAKKALKRITDLFKNRPGATVCTLILASIIAFPIVFLAAGFGTGAYLGVHFPTHPKRKN